MSSGQSSKNNDGDQPTCWEALSPLHKMEQIRELMQSPYWNHFSDEVKQRWLEQYRHYQSLHQGFSAAPFPEDPLPLDGQPDVS